MFRFTVFGFVILSLCCPLFFCNTSWAFQAKSAPAQVPPGQTPNATANSSVAPVSQREVVNIVVDKMEDGVIKSKDGRTFEISSMTKVVSNARPATGMRIAELVFENGRLVTVTIK